MRERIVRTINNNLTNAVRLIDAISDDTYTNVSIGPYYSSIGSHIRHSLDFFDCIIQGVNSNTIDLTARKRDEVISTCRESAKNKIYEIQKQLESFIGADADYLL